MSFRSSLAIAVKALRRHKLQTALTMLGMTIGVAAVLTMIALGSGAEAAIEQQVRAAGMNLIVVTAGNYQMKTEEDIGGVVDHQALRGGNGEGTRYSTLGPRYSVLGIRVVPAAFRTTFGVLEDPSSEYRVPRTAYRVRPAGFHPEDDPMEKHDHPTARQRLGDLEAGLGAAATLSSGDADAIRRLPGVQYVAEGVHQNAHVTGGAGRWFTRLNGSDAQLPMIRRAWSFPHGRYFSAREQRNAAQVIVLGSVAAARLFGAVDPVGKDVTIWNQSFRVVGVVASTSWVVAPAPGDGQFDAVYVPFTTVHQLLNVSKLNDITITAASTGDVTRVSKDVTALLRARHGIGLAAPDDFTVATQARQALANGGMRPDVARAVVGNVAGLEKVTLEQLAKTLERASRTMTALLASIAGVSLLVGGIGIMNIMLLSVTERTREIGVRRAVGARARDVRRQFVAEAVTLSLAGGFIGILLGAAASIGIAQLLQWSTSISLAAVVLSFGVAALVGIFFGWYPARQAARLDPIQSLRYE
ncbi:MAG TPA: ABC transporter permease [Vicinamibacterales bacterium]|jgi:ABC-type antimicrobial peptide transport system permease subunit|nr:ABC transporter permease [Vicinamibacterales bacterium]